MKDKVKNKKINVLGLSAVEVYELVLSRKLKLFPPNFWSSELGLKNAAEITRYLIEDRFKWSEDDIRKKLTQQFFYDNKLCGMLRQLFNSSPYKAINYAYPNTFKPWDFKMAPWSYWNKENCIDAIKWLIEEKLKWDEESIKKNLTQKTFTENNLYGMLVRMFNYSPYEAINTAYPGKFKCWEFNSVPQGYWNIKTGTEVVKWLIEENLNWSIDDIKANLTKKVFKDNGLEGMLQHVFNYSPFCAIDTVYPNKIKPWELKQTPQGFWNYKTAREATKWLIEEKLKWGYEEILIYISANTFRENCLAGLLKKFKSSPYLILQNAYPDKDWSKLVSRIKNR
jgi:predicted transposase YbfD/YdcC